MVRHRFELRTLLLWAGCSNHWATGTALNFNGKVQLLKPVRLFANCCILLHLSIQTKSSLYIICTFCFSKSNAWRLANALIRIRTWSASPIKVPRRVMSPLLVASLAQGQPKESGEIAEDRLVGQLELICSESISPPGFATIRVMLWLLRNPIVLSRVCHVILQRPIRCGVLL